MRQTNWIDASDIHSFYFTRFPEEMNETELWYEFKKWGDVREVFIARNCNRRGKRYGFVRFNGVEDVRWLERKLDNLVVRGLKMHVNIPKHGRERMIQGEANRNDKYRMEKTSDTLLEGEKGKDNLEGAKDNNSNK